MKVGLHQKMCSFPMAEAVRIRVMKGATIHPNLQSTVQDLVDLRTSMGKTFELMGVVYSLFAQFYGDSMGSSTCRKYSADFGRFCVAVWVGCEPGWISAPSGLLTKALVVAMRSGRRNSACWPQNVPWHIPCHRFGARRSEIGRFCAVFYIMVCTYIVCICYIYIIDIIYR